MAESDNLRAALEAIAQLLDGRKAADSTVSRRRSVFYSCLSYAVEKKIFAEHPLKSISWEPPNRVKVIDPRRVPGPELARKLLDAVPMAAPRVGHHLRAFYACLYFAGLRPSEAVNLKIEHCTLPETGWGRLTLPGSSPASGKHWTDSGELHEERGLKHRAKGATRPVPIPPELVTILRGHIARFGVANDGRLFRSERGNRLAPVSFENPWKRVRKQVLTEQQLRSPLAGTPYDLRHACLSLWLSSGIPPTEVAERAGHSVKMLLGTYAHCIEGEEDQVNRRIEAALGTLQSLPTEQTQRTATPRGHHRRAVPRLFREHRQSPGPSGAQSPTSNRAQNSPDAGQDVRPQVGGPGLNDGVGRLHSGG